VHLRSRPAILICCWSVTRPRPLAADPSYRCRVQTLPAPSNDEKRCSWATTAIPECIRPKQQFRRCWSLAAARLCVRWALHAMDAVAMRQQGSGYAQGAIQSRSAHPGQRLRCLRAQVPGWDLLLIGLQLDADLVENCIPIGAKRCTANQDIGPRTGLCCAFPSAPAV